MTGSSEAAVRLWISREADCEYPSEYEKFEKTVSGAQIKALETVNDILAYME